MVHGRSRTHVYTHACTHVYTRADTRAVQLKEMGFTDEDRIRAVLEAANGDVIAAVEMLSDK